LAPRDAQTLGSTPLDRHASRAVDILIGYPHDGECVFTIPADMHNECDSLSREMTGEPVVSAAFFFMLNSGICWESIHDQHGNATGFAIRGMNMKSNTSEEEGVRLAKEMTQRAMEKLERLLSRKEGCIIFNQVCVSNGKFDV
jgi:hypothetical protein